MANNPSAKKRIRTNEKRRQQNKANISQVKTLVKNTMNAKEKEEAEKIYKKAVSKIDKAASKGYIHPNNAARKKSQLTRHLNKLES